ncbi:MAG: hypothetical protein GY702_14990 [Desulfobulbaceae bacterium]|nr:hypothetical protein [Desulfobulbaceae bacterium]
MKISLLSRQRLIGNNTSRSAVAPSQGLSLFLATLVVVTLSCFLAGCTSQYHDQRVQVENDVFDKTFPQPFSFQNRRDNDISAGPPTTRETFAPPHKAESPKRIQPKFKELSPLDTEKISISFVEEGYRQIFQILARAAGLNLVLDPQLENLLSTFKLTAEYQEMQLRSVLDATSNILNVTWREEHSTLFVEPYLSETIHLDFIVSINQSTFSVGGDVLGGGGSGGGDNAIENPLTGRFEVGGQISETVTDIYSNIENTVGQLLEEDGEFILNRQTGTLLVRGRPRLITEIQDYLSELQRKYSKQVLIEAQIIEVDLSKSQQLGIDWKNISVLASSQPIQDLGQTIVNVVGDSSGNDSFYNLTVNADKYSVGAVFRALKQYGNLKVLSNPRLKTMNGQSAVISVGQSVSYLRSLTQTTEGTGDDRTSDITTEIGAIFDGILLGVTPVIKNNGSVALHIVPIKSEIVSLDQQQIGDDSSYRITFPTVNLREISTIVDIKPGNLIMLGGLIMEREQEEEFGLPILGDLPFFGWIFKERKTSLQKVEMVVILQVSVLE